MGLGIVGNLVAHARPQRDGAAILELGFQLTLGAQQNVAFQAPVVSEIARRVLHHADPDVAKLLSPPERAAALTFVLGGLDLGPIRDTEGNIGHLHRQLRTSIWVRTVSLLAHPSFQCHGRLRIMKIVNIAAYKFLPLTDLRTLRARLQTLCKDANLKGTILLSPEGINLFVAGAAHSIERLLAELRSWPGLEDLQPKLSETDHQPFRRMLVRLKKEIIAFGVEGIDPARRTSPKLSAKELKRWLDEGRPVTLLDTRNDYEVKLGTFRNAIPIGIDHFRDFPQGVARLSPELKKQPIVMFCTGGIRCEKAGPYMEREGFESVFQLDGGILKYFEEVGGAHYDGECFVFDQRVGLDPEPARDWSVAMFQLSDSAERG